MVGDLRIRIRVQSEEEEEVYISLLPSLLLQQSVLPLSLPSRMVPLVENLVQVHLLELREQVTRLSPDLLLLSPLDLLLLQTQLDPVHSSPNRSVQVGKISSGNEKDEREFGTLGEFHRVWEERGISAMLRLLD